MILGLKKPRHSPIQVETDTILEFVMAYIRTELRTKIHSTPNMFTFSMDSFCSQPLYLSHRGKTKNRNGG